MAHPGWGQGLWEEKLTVHSRGLPKNIAMGLETLQIWMIVVGGGQGGREEVGEGVGRAIVEAEEEEMAGQGWRWRHCRLVWGKIEGLGHRHSLACAGCRHLRDVTFPFTYKKYKKNM